MPSQIPRRPADFKLLVRAYAWWIAKNVIGYVLILAGIVLGLTLPGPGGTPLFIIGFALITFPGKRQLTARVLRGLPIDPSGPRAKIAAALAALAIPTALFWLSTAHWPRLWDARVLRPQYTLPIAVAAFAVFYILMRLATRGVNILIGLVPRARRSSRPWMRRRGIDLLPPRRRRRLRVRSPEQPAQTPDEEEQEIMELDESIRSAPRRLWKRAFPWLRRLAILGLLVVIFQKMVKPVGAHWHEVGQRVLDYNPLRFAVAALIFAVFLVVFRATLWRKMIAGFGHHLPAAAALRVWSTGELARYLPGTIWQVLGRVHLIRPYGVSAAICSTTQILDIAAFLLANIVLGLACVLWFAGKADATMRPYLIGAAALVPLLGLSLHPKIFYFAAGRILKRLGRPAFTQRLRGVKLLKYFALYLVGLLLQSFAVWVLLGDGLDIKLDHWWRLAGPYCLAWSAGFVVGWWTPGGMGVRELVFIGMANLTMSAQTRAHFGNNPDALTGYLIFCSVLLRLWTIAGELTVAAIAYAADFKGALNRPDAPGRSPPTAPAPPASPPAHPPSPA